MPLYETESLVLKSFNLAEADRIVVFLTRDFGIIRGVAKGAKRLNSRFGSTLEPFSTVNLEYFVKEDRELVSLRHVDLIRSSFAEASDPEILPTFSYLSDLLIAFVPPHDPSEKLYRMVKACIASGCRTKDETAAIRLYFELWLLRLGGYMPDWSRCDACKRSLGSDESANLQADFHLMCENCRKVRSHQTLAGSNREVFYQAQRLAPAEFIAYAADKVEFIADVSKILKRIISNVIGREVAAEKTFAVNF